MQTGEVRHFARPADFRRWLKANHAKAAELWVGFWKVDSGQPSITWPQSVDEALCVGWIDGVRKSLGDKAYTIRFTPRRPGSVWSAVNIERFAVLDAEGRVQPAGRTAFEARREDRSRIYAFEQGEVAFEAGQLAQFQAHAAAWTFFAAQPPGYRKVVTWWVISAKQAATRDKRLQTLIEACTAGQRLR